MKNLRIYLPMVDGSSYPLDFKTGKELIHGMVSDDFGPPPISLQIEGKTEDGKTVRIGIPYSESDKAIIRIE